MRERAAVDSECRRSHQSVLPPPHADQPDLASSRTALSCAGQRADRRLLARRMSAPAPPFVTAAGVPPLPDGAAAVSIPAPGWAWRRRSLAGMPATAVRRVTSGTHGGWRRNTPVGHTPRLSMSTTLPRLDPCPHQRCLPPERGPPWPARPAGSNATYRGQANILERPNWL